MNKYLLQLLEKEVNQLKAILRKLEYTLETTGNDKLIPVIEKQKTKLLIAEGYRKKFISIKRPVSGCICEFIHKGDRCKRKAKYEMQIYTPTFPDIGGEVIVNMCEEHGSKFNRYVGIMVRKYCR